MSRPLSLIASYDELIRCEDVLLNGDCEKEFLQFAMKQEDMRLKYLASVQECQRLQSVLDKAYQESADLERRLSHARRLLDEEKIRRRIAEHEKGSLETQMAMVREFLFNDDEKSINDETKEKLKFLNSPITKSQHKNKNVKDLHKKNKSNNVVELDSTGSILSDLSCFSKSEDDLDISSIKREWKSHRPSSEYFIKKRRSINSCDKITATTTIVIPNEEPLTASSVIEIIPKVKIEDGKSKPETIDISESRTDKTAPSVPIAECIMSGSDSDSIFKPSPNAGGYTFNMKTVRAHNFLSKTVIKPEICTTCEKRIRFGKMVLKCRDCKATAHSECKNLVPLPCVPTGIITSFRGISGTIADYTPMIPPMVPSLVVHCINEVELRGMSEKGLYRVNGGVSEVKRLKQKFLKGNGAPKLSDVDIPTICSTLKDFLRSLREPLITMGLWGDFVRATTISDKQDADAALYQAISELPQPNRDTLAFLILHLQRVASCLECEMPISNLAKVFAPTLIGYSGPEPSVVSIICETKNLVAIVENLLKIPSDYWANFVNPESMDRIGNKKIGELRHTPSQESLFQRSNSHGFFNTPLGNRSFRKKNKKYLVTPPVGAGF